MKKTTLFLLLSFSILNFSCKEKVREETVYSIRTDIRLGNVFYSIFMSKTGKLYVIKGKESNDIDSLKVLSSEKSTVVKSDLIKTFIGKLSKFENNPKIKSSIVTDSPRVEIYYDQRKIYDTFKMDAEFWDLFLPVVPLVPKGYNPFRPDEHPFG
jgi:hypothetical protein